MDNRVFAGLSNGQLAIFRRDEETGHWLTNEPKIVDLCTSPVLKLLPVAGKLWCAISNHVKVFNANICEVELTFHASVDTSRTVHSMVTSGLNVWISIHHSPIIKLYHATTYECLVDVNVAPAVSKILSTGCDDIIRQHKAACLRVTTLLASKELLWIGTSAGVILTLPVPHLTAHMSKLDSWQANVSAVAKGHTGHVRFLTAVEVGGQSLLAAASQKFQPPGHVSLHSNPVQVKAHHNVKGQGSRRSSLTSSHALMGSKVLIVSGGDGFEDFSSTSPGVTYNETAGRDDSTNHLLLWSV